MVECFVCKQDVPTVTTMETPDGKIVCVCQTCKDNEVMMEALGLAVALEITEEPFEMFGLFG